MISSLQWTGDVAGYFNWKVVSVDYELKVFGVQNLFISVSFFFTRVIFDIKIFSFSL